MVAIGRFATELEYVRVVAARMREPRQRADPLVDLVGGLEQSCGVGPAGARGRKQPR